MWSVDHQLLDVLIISEVDFAPNSPQGDCASGEAFFSEATILLPFLQHLLHHCLQQLPFLIIQWQPPSRIKWIVSCLSSDAPSIQNKNAPQLGNLLGSASRHPPQKSASITSAVVQNQSQNHLNAPWHITCTRNGFLLIFVRAAPDPNSITTLSAWHDVTCDGTGVA